MAAGQPLLFYYRPCGILPEVAEDTAEDFLEPEEGAQGAAQQAKQDERAAHGDDPGGDRDLLARPLTGVRHGALQRGCPQADPDQSFDQRRAAADERVEIGLGLPFLEDELH